MGTMGTTARIYLVTDHEDPQQHELGLRLNMAKHSRPEVVLFQYMDGYPRSEHGLGVLDRLEAAFATAPPRILRVASELAVHLLIEAAGRSKRVDESGYNLVPSHPTVGAIICYDYLVICHARTKEAPTIYVQLGSLWRREKDFARFQADDEAGYELLLASQSRKKERERDH